VEQTPATPVEPLSGQTARTDGSADDIAAQPPPGFAARGRLRRRARFLRKARELAYRDLGGLVFSLHRFAQRNDDLVLAKLTTLGQIDTELRALESALQEPQPITVLREAGITACARCAAIHSSEDRFCPHCGLPLSRRVDLPVAGPAASSVPAQPPRTAAAGAWAASPGGAPSQSPTPPPAPPPSQPQPAGPQVSSPRTSAPARGPAPQPPATPASSPRARGRAPVPPRPTASEPEVETVASANTQNTQVWQAPPGEPPAPGPADPAQAGGSEAPDGAATPQPQRPGDSDEDQPTEIVRPSSPAGS
jgi:hypothetical protein